MAKIGGTYTLPLIAAFGVAGISAIRAKATRPFSSPNQRPARACGRPPQGGKPAHAPAETVENDGD
jgi:hypothetical protein